MVQLYPLGRQGFADGSIIWSTGNIKAILLKSGYTYSAAHEYVSDLTPASYDNGRSANLSSKTQALGLCTAANSSLVATAAVACNAIAIFQDTGTDSTSRLICYIDGIQQLVIPVTYGSSQTSLACAGVNPNGDLTLGNMANGTVLNLISGTGPATITLSGAYTAGQFTLSVALHGLGHHGGGGLWRGRHGLGSSLHACGGSDDQPRLGSHQRDIHAMKRIMSKGTRSYLRGQNNKLIQELDARAEYDFDRPDRFGELLHP